MVETIKFGLGIAAVALATIGVVFWAYSSFLARK